MKSMSWMMVSIVTCALIGGCVGAPPPSEGDENTGEAKEALGNFCTTTYYSDATKTTEVGWCEIGCGAPRSCEGQITSYQTSHCFACQ